MTPKEYAQKLIEKFYGKTPTRTNQSEIAQDWQFAKQCALICVDEILLNFGNMVDGKPFYSAHNAIKFYQQVKQEIQNL